MLVMPGISQTVDGRDKRARPTKENETRRNASGSQAVYEYDTTRQQPSYDDILIAIVPHDVLLTMISSLQSSEGMDFCPDLVDMG
jgi:hypothetical protein